LLTYLKLSGKTVGLLLNFNEAVLTKGLKRMVNRYAESGEIVRTSAPSAREPHETPRLGVSAVK
jgi:hypothetical protein